MDDPTRASDADRDRVVSRLQDALVEGRLSVDELDRLTGAAHDARTVGDLDRLVAHLPAPPVAEPPAPVTEPEPGGSYSPAQIAAAVALTVLIPVGGRVAGLAIALSLLRDERSPQRRRLLRAWAAASAAVLALELVLLVFVLHV